MKIKLTPKTKWLIWASALSSALIVTYIILHASCQQGKVDLSLNKEQINAVNMILENDTIPERAQLTAFNYISNVLSLTDAKVLKRFFDTFQHKDIKAIIPEYAFEVKSYFWLKEPRVFLERIFWSLFGLMANLMYSVNIAGVFEKKKIYEHIGKIFYTPASTIIIYLSLYALVNSGSISLNGVGKSVIVLSFILGFFTRRTIVLLGKIKDLILPLGKDEPKKEKTNTDTGVNEIKGIIKIKGISDEMFEKNIEHAAIKITALEFDYTDVVTPDKEGMFYFDNIPNGNYKIEAELVINKIRYFEESTIELIDKEEAVEIVVNLKSEH